jgi:hypothetical protein
MLVLSDLTNASQGLVECISHFTHIQGSQCRGDFVQSAGTKWDADDLIRLGQGRAPGEELGHTLIVTPCRANTSRNQPGGRIRCDANGAWAT